MAKSAKGCWRHEAASSFGTEQRVVVSSLWRNVRLREIGYVLSLYDDDDDDDCDDDDDEDDDSSDESADELLHFSITDFVSVSFFNGWQDLFRAFVSSRLPRFAMLVDSCCEFWVIRAAR